MAYNCSAKILVKLSYGMDHPLFHCLNSRNRVSIVVIGYHSNINLWHFFVLMPMLNSTLKLNVTGSGKRYTIAHIIKIELLVPRDRVSSQL